MPMVMLARAAFAALALGLALLIGLAIEAQTGAFMDEVRALLAPTWGLVTFADLYLGFVIAATVIMLAERRLWVGLAWALPIFVLGNVVTAAWLALRLPSVARRLRAR